MTPAARVQAAIEILDAVIAAARSNGPPAERLIAQWFRTRRFAGSKDRRAVREHVFAAIRHCGEVPPSGRAAMLALAQDDPAMARLFDGSRYGPVPVVPGEPGAVAGIAPAWLSARLAASGLDDGERAALIERAPLDLRVNTLKATPDEVAAELAAATGLGVDRTAAPLALRLPTGTAIEGTAAFDESRAEVQDSGSQIACLAAAVRPGETVIDLCAGAGGKTLAFAAAMGNEGRIIACDTDRGRLGRLLPRAARAGAGRIETRLLNPMQEEGALADLAGAADLVFVDAPCSGTGVWRRQPDSRWRLSEGALEARIVLQARLLDLAVGLVRPGGRIVYAVCSLLDAEGAEQAARLLSRHERLSARLPPISAGRPRGSGIRLTPFHDGTDGFFIAGFESA